MPRLTLLIVGLLLSLVLAPAAGAASRNQIIKDCADDGQLQGHYTQAELRDARQNMPSDVAEYTDCGDVLRRAELPDSKGGSGGGGSGGGGGTSGSSDGQLLTAQTEADHKELAQAAKAGSQPVSINGAKVVPGASGLQSDATHNSIPSTLLAALILLGLGGAALALPAVRRKLPGLGSDSGLGSES